MKKHSKLFCFFLSLLFFGCMNFLFSPIFNSSTLIFPYAVNPFDIVTTYPTVWHYIKLVYSITFFISTYVLLNSFFNFIFFNLKIPKHIPKKSNPTILQSNFNLLLGKISSSEEKIYIPEKSLYQNILVTGTIGSRQNKFCNGTFS